MLRGGQVICGRNATRIQLNLAMKQAAGFPGVYPSGAGEKIICLKNRNDLGIVNGMFLELSEVRDESEHCFSAVVRSEDGETLGAGDDRQFIYKGHFDEHVAPDRERERRDHWIRKGLIEAVWGYAITCHKSQGSQADEVTVVLPPADSRLLTRELFYTAVTRAKQKVRIVGSADEVRAAVQRQALRASGLRDRLRAGT